MRAFLSALALLAYLPVFAGEHAQLSIAYVGLADDARHADFRGYANIVLKPGTDPFLGARTAVGEGKVLARALGISIDLQRAQAKDAAGLVDAIRERADVGVSFFLLDAPGPVVAEVAGALADRDLLLFNVTAPDDSLRGERCAANLLHTYPSRSMLADALVQFAVAHEWDEALVLQGGSTEDAASVKAFRRAAKRFGLDIADVRELQQGNDPRERARNNIALLTQGDYDAVFVADAALSLGRYVPYQAKEPRPVIGDAGLRASAWHWAAERYGGPQLNQRFERIAHRRMNGEDWAAWAAVRVLLDGLRATRTTAFKPLRDYLLGDELNLDTYKGLPGSFRPWDGQLRQPVLLHTENAVTGYAPFEGFLHPTHNLDTLGADRAESTCKAGKGGKPARDRDRLDAGTNREEPKVSP